MQTELRKPVQWLIVAIALALSTAVADARSVQIVALGDSNTAGLRVGRKNAFPAIMEASLRAAGYDVTISNRGISGDTTGGMLSRVDRAVPRGIGIAIVQGGYNDYRRGIPAQTTEANIEAILTRLRSHGVKVVLCGFPGAQWAGIARRHQAVLVPGSDCYDVNNRGFDGLHMNKAGHRVVAQRLTPLMERLLGKR